MWLSGDVFNSFIFLKGLWKASSVLTLAGYKNEDISESKECIWSRMYGGASPSPTAMDKEKKYFFFLSPPKTSWTSSGLESAGMWSVGSPAQLVCQVRAGTVKWSGHGVHQGTELGGSLGAAFFPETPGHCFQRALVCFSSACLFAWHTSQCCQFPPLGLSWVQL